MVDIESSCSAAALIPASNPIGNFANECCPMCPLAAVWPNTFLKPCRTACNILLSCDAIAR